MYCSHLSLTGFRNYARLELDLPTGVTVVVGDNAQGKSNLLEALYMLATTKSFRAGSDRELINWRVSGTELAYARLAAQVVKATGRQKIEIVVREESKPDAGEGTALTTGKRLKVNEVPKRAIDFIGAVNVVVFAPSDIELVDGPPAIRRRYLDITISQVDPHYVRALSRYNRVLVQRNNLLRQIRDRRSRPEHLDPWDHELATPGAYIVQQRVATLAELGELARDVFRGLTGQREQIEVDYRPSLDLGMSAGGAETAPIGVNTLAESFRARLRLTRGRDVAAGASLLGPHRDDLAFLVDGRPMGTFGSRGQQRTTALALKLAEGAFLRKRTGEEPIILLDDVLSELDDHRRRHVLEAIAVARQVIFTTTELEPFDPEFLGRANVLRVHDGALSPEPTPLTAGPSD